MIVNFGRGRCPMCGDIGAKLPEDCYACSKCNVVFDNFSVTFMEDHDADNDFQLT